jgi:hypothetical protein
MKYKICMREKSSRIPQTNRYITKPSSITSGENKLPGVCRLGCVARGIVRGVEHVPRYILHSNHFMSTCTSMSHVLGIAAYISSLFRHLYDLLFDCRLSLCSARVRFFNLDEAGKMNVPRDLAAIVQSPDSWTSRGKQMQRYFDFICKITCGQGCRVSQR